MKRTLSLVFCTLICSMVVYADRRLELVDPDLVTRNGITYLVGSSEPLTADVTFWNKSGLLRTQFTLSVWLVVNNPVTYESNPRLN